jgi:hypothetical protein
LDSNQFFNIYGPLALEPAPQLYEDTFLQQLIPLHPIYRCYYGFALIVHGQGMTGFRTQAGDPLRIYWNLHSSPGTVGMVCIFPLAGVELTATSLPHPAKVIIKKYNYHAQDIGLNGFITLCWLDTLFKLFNLLV